MFAYSDAVTLSYPDTLFNQCTKYMSKNPEKVFGWQPVYLGYRLKAEDKAKGIKLPEEVCEAFLHTCHKNNILNDKIANIFYDVEHTRVKRIRLWDCKISVHGMGAFVLHEPEEILIGCCEAIHQDSLDQINEYGKNLRSLIIERNVPMFTTHPHDNIKRDYLLRLPKLERLTIKMCECSPSMNIYGMIANDVPQLTHLDLSHSLVLPSDIVKIKNMKCLQSLILHDVPAVKESINSICEMQTLTCLDISQINEGAGDYIDPDRILTEIIRCLPNLHTLDISGTNLAGNGVFIQMDYWETHLTNHSDIAGLAARISNPLKFLGLSYARHEACFRRNIPAVEIAGEANEDQLIVAGRVNMYKPNFICRVLNDFFHLLRYEVPTRPKEIMPIILDALSLHTYERDIQIAGNAAFFYLVKNKDNLPVTFDQRKCIIVLLMDRMILHQRADTVIRNGLLILCQFYVPKDFLFMYDTLIAFLLQLIGDVKMEGFVHRVSMYLLNSLACQVDDAQKRVLGELKVIENMLSLIKVKLKARLCDDIMEVAWSTMWNVTDETSVNCKRFLDGGGMVCFQRCLSHFPNKNELMRNMMGLLGNVAEVKDLRPTLMNYMDTISNLLKSVQDGIEVSYNAAGVIAHLASDGEDAWTYEKVPRQKALLEMEAAIDGWNVLNERNINYRSFKPILQLATCYHTQTCQYWAVWALANLTTVYRVKYCEILQAEDGLPIMEAIFNDPTRNSKIRNLAEKVIFNCQLSNRLR